MKKIFMGFLMCLLLGSCGFINSNNQHLKANTNNLSTIEKKISDIREGFSKYGIIIKTQDVFLDSEIKGIKDFEMEKFLSNYRDLVNKGGVIINSESKLKISVNDLLKIDRNLKIVNKKLQTENPKDLFFKKSIDIDDLILGIFYKDYNENGEVRQGFLKTRMGILKSYNFNENISHKDLENKVSEINNVISQYGLELNELDYNILSIEDKNYFLNISIENIVVLLGKLNIKLSLEANQGAISLNNIISFNKALDALYQAFLVGRKTGLDTEKTYSINEIIDLKYFEDVRGELNIVKNEWKIKIDDINLNLLDEYEKHLFEKFSFEELEKNLTFVLGEKSFALKNQPESVPLHDLLRFFYGIKAIKQNLKSGFDVNIPSEISLEDLLKFRFLDKNRDREKYNIYAKYTNDEFPYLKSYPVDGFTMDNEKEDNMPVIAYIKDNLENKSNKKIAVYIHGGYWVSESKELAFESDAPLVQKLVDNDYIVLSMDYRLIDLEKNQNNQQDCIDDIRKFFKDLNSKKSLNINGLDYRIDKNNIYSFGGSAGGHLSLMAANLRKEDGKPIIKKIVAFAPLIDYFSNYIFRGSKYSPVDNLYLKLTSAMFDYPNKTINTDEKREIVNNISPKYHVKDIHQDTEILLISSLNDHVVNVDQIMDYYDELRNNEKNVKAYYDASGGHMLTRVGDIFRQEVIFDFFQK